MGLTKTSWKTFPAIITVIMGTHVPLTSSSDEIMNKIQIDCPPGSEVICHVLKENLTESTTSAVQVKLEITKRTPHAIQAYLTWINRDGTKTQGTEIATIIMDAELTDVTLQSFAHNLIKASNLPENT